MALTKIWKTFGLNSAFNCKIIRNFKKIFKARNFVKKIFINLQILLRIFLEAKNKSVEYTKNS